MKKSTIPGLAEVSYISQGLYGHGCPFGLSCSSCSPFLAGTCFQLLGGPSSSLCSVPYLPSFQLYLFVS